WEGWRDNGGNTSTVALAEGHLLITSTSRNHHAIAALLAAIRRGEGPMYDDALYLTDDAPRIRVYAIGNLLDLLVGNDDPQLTCAQRDRTEARTCILAHLRGIDSDGWRINGGDTGWISEFGDLRWRINGGDTGWISEFGDLLIITQTGTNHEAIAAQLDELTGQVTRRADASLRETIDQALAALPSRSYTDQDMPFVRAVLGEVEADADGETDVAAAPADHLLIDRLLDELEAAASDLDRVRKGRPIAAPDARVIGVDQALASIAQLAAADRIDDATRVADALLQATGAGAQPAARMRQLLADQTLDSTPRNRDLATLASPSRLRLEALGTVNALARRIDTGLLQRITSEPETGDPATERLPIAVLTAASDSDAVARLKQAGMQVEDVVEDAGIVVGRAALTDIPTIALDASTRRVEPLAVP
ncbi:MAG: hypothetical protein KDA21_04295, partial [Phycisphaerales bacterium]|nr:hypothetical protein [Phycisphaerales bacterium]